MLVEYPRTTHLPSGARGGSRRLGAARATGSAGTILLAVSSGATGVWPAGFDQASIPVLGRLVHLPVLATTLAVLGLGLLVTGWLVLGRFAWSDRQLRVPTRYLYRTFALWAAPLLLVPAMFSGDFYSYLAQGAIADHGLNPATHSPADALGVDNELVRSVSSYWRHTTAPYGPVFGLLTQTIHHLVGNDVVLSVVAYRLLSLAGIALIAWSLPRLARWTGGSHETAVWVGVLNPLVLCHLVAGMHNDSLMLGLMVTGSALALDQRTRFVPLAAGLTLITLAANIKLPAAAALLVVGVVLVQRCRPRSRRTIITAATTVAVPVAVTAVVCITSGFGFGWLLGLGTPATVHSWLAPTNQVGFLVGGIGAVFGIDITATAIGVAEAVGAGIGLVLLVMLLRRLATTRSAPLHGLGLVFTIALVCGPSVQPWYVLWLVIPLGVSALQPVHLSRLAWASVAVTLAVPPLGVAVTGNVAQIAAAYAVGVPITLVVLAVLLGRQWQIARRTTRITPT